MEWFGFPLHRHEGVRSLVGVEAEWRKIESFAAGPGGVSDLVLRNSMDSIRNVEEPN